MRTDLANLSCMHGKKNDIDTDLRAFSTFDSRVEF